MQPIRKINKREKVILKYLIKQASLQLPEEWYTNILVQQMADGEMGSFLIFQDASDIGLKRKFRKQISEFEFVDDDGVRVLVSLNIDDQNKPFEVDVWKTDYNPVLNIRIPG
jgi:hypothetical protein